MPGSKLKLLYLADFFLEHTDKNHSVTIKDIITFLSRNGICVDRRTIYEDINLLIDYGYKIEKTKTKTHNYFLAKRDFELSEVKIMIDILQASPALTSQDSLQLIKKLEGLISNPDANLLNRQVYVLNRAKNANPRLFEYIDIIHYAISSGKQIAFKYFDYIGTGKKEFRRNSNEYIVNPVALSVDSFYYLITYSSKHECYIHYRVDRMENIRPLNQNREPVPAGFDLGQYVKRLFNMFDGEMTHVSFQITKQMINIFSDKFGSDFMIIKKADDNFHVTVEAAVSPTFYAWIFSLGMGVKILGPTQVIEGFCRFGDENLNRYR